MNNGVGDQVRYMLAVSSLLFLAWGTAHPLSARAVENAAEKAPDSYEFKVLLLNDKFVERDAAIETFLERLKRIAEQHGATAKWKKPAKRKIMQREVRFLDTCDRRIKNHGLIFRTRVEMKNGCDPVQSDSCVPAEAKVTLKQRFEPGADGVLFNMTPELAAAKAFPDQVVSGDLKFEEDYGWKPVEAGSSVKEVLARRSWSSSVKATDLGGREHVRGYAALGDLMELYKEGYWGELKKHADEALVSTCPISSTVVKVGKLRFGHDVECKASFTFWRKETDQMALASEFSYSCDDSGGAFAGIKDAVKAVFEELIEGDLVNHTPKTKTAIAYSCSPN